MTAQTNPAPEPEAPDVEEEEDDPPLELPTKKEVNVDASTCNGEAVLIAYSMLLVAREVRRFRMAFEDWAFSEETPEGETKT